MPSEQSSSENRRFARLQQGALSTARKGESENNSTCGSSLIDRRDDPFNLIIFLEYRFRTLLAEIDDDDSIALEQHFSAFPLALTATGTLHELSTVCEGLTLSRDVSICALNSAIAHSGGSPDAE